MLVLVFELEGRRFGLPADRVREVVRAAALTPIPGAPPVVEGLLDLRGEVLPVLDLRRRFEVPIRPLKLSDQLIVLELAARTVALRVDAVGALLRLEDGQLEPVPSAALATSLRGLVRLAEGLLLLPEPERFLLEAEAEALSSARSPAEASP
jgi:purine-binding chemotaxis protein CheW